MRLHYSPRLTAAALASMLSTALLAQAWNIETVHRGEARAVLVRGDQVLVIGSQSPPSDKMKTFGLPPAGAAWLRPEPRVRMVTSGSRTQLGRVSIIDGGNGPRSRYEPLNRRWAIEAAGLPAFVMSDNGATIVVAHLDVHNRGDVEVTIHSGNDGKRLEQLRRPGLRRVHVSSDGATVVLAGEGGVFVFAVSEGAVRAIGDLPAAPATELAARGDWIARATNEGVAVHQISDGRFSNLRAATLPTRISSSMKFDDKSTHLAVADSERFHFFELNGLSELWSVPTGEPTTVTSIDVAGDGSLVGVATVTVKRRETRSSAGEAEAEVRLLRRDGTTEVLEAIPGDPSSAQAPVLTFFAEDRKLLIETRTNVFTLSSKGALK